MAAQNGRLPTGLLPKMAAIQNGRLPILLPSIWSAFQDGGHLIWPPNMAAAQHGRPQWIPKMVAFQNLNMAAQYGCPLWPLSKMATCQDGCHPRWPPTPQGPSPFSARPDWLGPHGPAPSPGTSCPAPFLRVQKGRGPHQHLLPVPQPISVSGYSSRHPAMLQVPRCPRAGGGAGPASGGNHRDTIEIS